MACISPICSTAITKFPQEDGVVGSSVDSREANEAFYYFADHMAGRVLRPIPVYTDWWNSPSVGVYWRSWNKPVYHFMKRHIYSPLVGRGWSSHAASAMVFV